MMDADVCAQMSAGEPAIGLAALTELRSFLAIWLRDHPSGADSVAIAAANLASQIRNKALARGDSRTKSLPRRRM